jgi:hypothetical protein
MKEQCALVLGFPSVVKNAAYVSGLAMNQHKDVTALARSQVTGASTQGLGNKSHWVLGSAS